MISPSFLQIVPAIGQVEALVALREIRDRLAAHRHREPEPVAERRVEDLVLREPSGRIGRDEMDDLAAPTLDKRQREVVRGKRSDGGYGRATTAGAGGAVTCWGADASM